MADISKIKLGNTTYNVKDTTARSDINNLQTTINNIESITQTEIDEITDYTPASFPSPVYGYDTVADMQADTSLQEGMICHTNGFHTSGDGGAAYYTVGASGDIALQGGVYATQINTGDKHLGIMVLGDSYGEGYTPDGNVNSWISYFTTNAQRYGYTVYSRALGGTGF